MLNIVGRNMRMARPKLETANRKSEKNEYF